MTGITNNSGGARIDFLAYILVKTDKNSASVTAVNLAGTTLTGTTDSEGYALLTTTETGTYTVTVTESGQSETGTAVVTSNDNGAIIHVEILFRYILFAEGINRLGAANTWTNSAGAHNLTISQYNIVVQGKISGKNYGLYTGNKVDVTNYKHLLITGAFEKYYEYNLQVGLCNYVADPISGAGIIDSIWLSATETLTEAVICNVTNYNGSYYMFFRTQGTDSETQTYAVNQLTMSEIYLSKD